MTIQPHPYLGHSIVRAVTKPDTLSVKGTAKYSFSIKCTLIKTIEVRK